MSSFGKKIDKQAQDLAYTIYLFFKKKTEDPNSTEYKKNLKLIPTVAEATGLPEKTIVKIVMEQTSKCEDGDQVKMPNMKRYILLDNLAKCEVRRKVIQFYSQYQKAPTLKALNTTFVIENVLVSTSTYLQRLLKDNGFKYVDCKSKHRILMERSSLVSTRWDYLQAINQYRGNGRIIIYVGETYISSTQKANEENAEIFQNSKDGGFIVLHAADSKGFLKGAILIIQSKFNRKHYLNDMNSDNFTWWVKEKLLPFVPPKSVIVMNNTSFNSDAVKPTYKSTKAEVENWLKNNKVYFEENLRKSDLLALIDNHQSSGDNVLNEMIINNGHEVLRIPAIHADLNTLEWIWRNVKKQVWTEEQLKLTLDMKQQVIENLLADYPQKEWQHCHDQVRAIELEYFQHHITLDQTVDEMLEKIRKDQISMDDNEDSDSNEEMDISEEEN